MKKPFFFLFLCLALHPLLAQGPYTVCLDGGGSKTAMQVLDNAGSPVILTLEDQTGVEVVAGGSNINVVGESGVRLVVNKLLQATVIDGERQSLVKDLAADGWVYAGMAGVGSPEREAAVCAILQDGGFDPARILVTSDAAMALRSVPGDGMVLIAGTGSICLAKKDGVTYRVGGLGRILGDEGSGYELGLLAIQAALAAEYGWGKPTALTEALKEHFKVDALRLIIPGVNTCLYASRDIAAVVPIVCRLAKQDDAVAREVLHATAGRMVALVDRMVQYAGLSRGTVHCVGGLFKSPFQEEFLACILYQLVERRKSALIVENKAHEHPAVVYAQQGVSSIYRTSLSKRPEHLTKDVTTSTDGSEA